MMKINRHMVKIIVSHDKKHHEIRWKVIMQHGEKHHVNMMKRYHEAWWKFIMLTWCFSPSLVERCQIGGDRVEFGLPNSTLSPPILFNLNIPIGVKKWRRKVTSGCFNRIHSGCLIWHRSGFWSFKFVHPDR